MYRNIKLIEGLPNCLFTYETLEMALRVELSTTTLSYRQIAQKIGFNHPQIWSFHKQNARLSYETLKELSILFERPFLLTNTDDPSQKTFDNVDLLARATRRAMTSYMDEGISYRKLSSCLRISHEWLRCFHTKNANIEVLKLMKIADFLEVYYALGNLDVFALE